MGVTDVDSDNPDDLIDKFAIDVDQIPIGNETTLTTYEGAFGFASLTLSFKAECSKYHYFPYCEEDGCQTIGNCTCVPGYTGSRCEIEIQECTENSCPEDTICDEELYSFTCLPLTTPDGVTNTDDCIGVNCNRNGGCEDGMEDVQCTPTTMSADSAGKQAMQL